MSPLLPITFCLWTSSKGHFGFKDIYRATLDHYDRQVPLSSFGARLAHIKVGSQELDIGDAMEADLKSRGFEVIKTVADWSRGTSHQHGILQDQRTVSRDPRFHTQPFMLLAEDDSPIVSSEIPLEDLLLQSCRMLAEDHELVTVRTLRPEDLSTTVTVPSVKPDRRWFHGEHYNLQPSIWRTRDFYTVANLIEHHWSQVSHIQCEMLLRFMTLHLSTSERRHLVYHPTYAHSPHLGVPDYPALRASLNL